MITSTSGLNYETKFERFQFGTVTLEIESLADIDRTIDQLFAIYQADGKTDLFEEMCPYFGTLWPAGRVLTEYLAQHLTQYLAQRNAASGEFVGLAGKRILEIGCGLAVPSLYLAAQGLKVVATDIHPDVPIFLKHNSARNQTVGVEFVELDWRSAPAEASSAQETETWDLILASDILYDKVQPEALLQFLKRSLRHGGHALIADPGRSYVEGFFSRARQQGFNVETSGLFGVLIGELRRDMVS